MSFHFSMGSELKQIKRAMHGIAAAVYWPIRLPPKLKLR
jgi:hypothetical protein